MEIEIKKLAPEHAEAYAKFFDDTPHDVNADEQKCYCVLWRSSETYTESDSHWFPTREERRARAIRYITDGKIKGYLAYSGGEIIGWCNATADCGCGVEYLSAHWPIGERDPGIKIKSIFCFVVAPQHKRKGVAKKLTDCVCADAAIEGFDYVEAYAYTKYDPASLEFGGPFEMYKKCGFYVHAEKDGKAVMRKKTA